MKKITESELKDRVARLKEKLVAEEQKVDEWSFLSPSSWFNGRDYGDSTSRDDVRTQDAAKNSTAGANMALVQNREQMVPGSTGSTEEGGVTYAIDDAGNKLAKINPQTQKWEMMPQAAPTGSAALDGTKPGADPATTIPGGPDTAVGGATPSAATTSGYKGSAGAQAIQKLNPDLIKDVNKIMPGQQFKMPDGSTYTVQKGDTLDGIAAKAGQGPGAAAQQGYIKAGQGPDAAAQQGYAKPAPNLRPTMQNDPRRLDQLNQIAKSPAPAVAPAPAPAVRESAVLDEIDRLVSLVHYR